MWQLRLLLLLLANPIGSRAQTTPCEPPNYRNIYGCTEFNTTRPQPELLRGITRTLSLADGFTNAAQPDITPIDGSLYDFIVIGAGTAGATIASRLSEWPYQSVLLLEAGDEEVYYMDIPMFAPLQQHNSSLNWNYTSVRRDTYCLGMIGELCRIPRGRVMGGTSTLNYMVATRGHPEDYNKWARDGNPGWAYNDVLKYFRKLENMRIPEYRENREQHGTRGPIDITYPPFRSPLAGAFLAAGAELGYPTPDYNSGNMVGFSYTQSTTFNGSRVSSNRGYLHSRLRENLDVSKRSLVSRILISPSRRAFGVEFIKDGRLITVYVTKEIILSAGAIGSPQLLMLSGIGPAEHLMRTGIRVQVDSPVGNNLQDHVTISGAIFTVDQPVSLSIDELVRPGTPYLSDYLQYQTGPFSTLTGMEAVFFNDVHNPRNLSAQPTMEQLFLTLGLTIDTPIVSVLGYKPEGELLLGSAARRHAWTSLSTVLKPKSRGTVRLQSASIHDKPLIDLNFFNHPDDMRTMIAGIRQAISIGRTAAMQRFNSTLVRLDLPACRQYQENSDEYLECVARNSAITAYHQCGTCKMGPVNDPTSVVDPTLQVIGVDGLRVADASIIPEIPAAHTNIPVFMIAEKAADMIKRYWGYPRRYLMN